jgi:hypothetical protein
MPALKRADRRGVYSSLALMILFLAFLALPVQALGTSEKGRQAPVASSTAFPDAPKNLLLFKADGHVLGFGPERVYMASSDHVLSIEFVDGRKVVPRATPPEATLPRSFPAAEKEIARSPGKADGPLELARVEYPNQWEGISVRYEATEAGLAESTYLIEPGCDVGAIRLRYNVPVKVGPDGTLRFEASSDRGWMTETAPVAWQEIEGARIPVEVAFKVRDGLVGFETGRYDQRHRLIIDPAYQWHTFYGAASKDDIASGIAVDHLGNVYITGTSAGTIGASWLGAGGVKPLHAHSGGTDIFVLKLNSKGIYQWHTFYGSSDQDWGLGIAVDTYSNVYVTGWSETNSGAWDILPVNPSGGGIDMVILKLDGNGKHLWHTFQGAVSGPDEGHAIAVDTNGNVYVTGSSNSTWGSPISPYLGNGSYHITVLKLESDGHLLWNTFYGASVSDSSSEGFGIALDAASNIYVTGYSTSTWRSDTDKAPLHPYSKNGKKDLVVLKLNGEGAYRWHTFYGSPDETAAWYCGEEGHAIAVDGSGNVFVTGFSQKSWAGSGGKAPLHAFTNGSENITVLKLNNVGTYQWHTFYGSGIHDKGYGIAVKGRDVYVTGSGYATWLGDGGANPLHPYGGSTDIAVLKLDTTGDYRWHTFYGGGAGGADDAYAVAVDANSNVYVAGDSKMTWLGDGGKTPIHAGAFGQGYSELTVLKLSDPVVPVKVFAPNGGQVLNSGSTFPVKWGAPVHAVNFRLYYSLDNAATWKKCHSSNYVSGTSYNWTVPVPSNNSTQCFLKVIGYTWNGKPAGTDVSDAPFTIATVRLTAPNGGNSLVSGNAVNITWKKNPTVKAVSSVVLYYTRNGGTTWNPIKTLTGNYETPGNYSYKWTVPSVTATYTQCKAKVVLKDANGVIVGNDASDSPFTISP